ncbi:MAG: nucleoside-triphosphatase [Bacillota bacterium]|nr:nucleoside-triphosphatase [Bacillota bacterium]
MHIFLTGTMRVGKSTLLRKALKAMNYTHLDLGGFYTVSLPSDFSSGEVYLLDASAAQPEYNRNNLIGIRWGAGKYTSFPAAFELYGAPLVEAARGRLLVMDELGVMESQSPSFCRAVLEKLDGQTPVLGVIKPKSAPLLDAIREHPRVRVIEVSEHNRDQLCEEIVMRLKRTP